jgi:PPOX class probable F420-dependent enzyme
VTDSLTEEDRSLLGAPNYAWVVTLQPDGAPHASITWIDSNESHVLVNTAVGRRKDRNVERDPRVTIAVQRGADAYDWISVEGVVEARELGEVADRHIDALSRAYDEQRWSSVEGQRRVRWLVRPVRIVRYGR